MQEDKNVSVILKEINVVDNHLKCFGYRHSQCLVLFINITMLFSIRSCMGVAVIAMTSGQQPLVVSENTHNEVPSIANKTDASNLTYNKEITNDKNLGEKTCSSAKERQNVNCLVTSASDTIAVVIGLGYRHAQCLLLFILISMMFCIRACMGVAMVVMTSAVKTQIYPTFDWSSRIQNIILASFFWGYMIMQIPGGVLIYKFGPRYLLSTSTIINSVICLIFPWAAVYGGWKCVVVCRVLQGMSQALLFPGIHTFFGKWAPIKERARLTGYVYGGQCIGAATGMPLAGFISATSLGWPGIFRVYGIASALVALLLWMFLVDSPAKHPKISTAEKIYIESDLIQQQNTRSPIPWISIFSCKAVWSSIFVHTGLAWTQVFLFTQIPDFMNKCMQVDIRLNGVMSALPFITMWISNFFFSWFSDWLINSKTLSVTGSRKLCSAIGGISAAMGLLSLCYVPKNIYIIESILVLSGGIKVAAAAAFTLNHIDRAPNFAGNLMSLSGLVAQFIASFCPVIVSYMLYDDSNLQDWRRAFFLTAGLLFCSNMVYLIFGSARQAPWNQLQLPKDPEIEDASVAAPMLSKKQDSYE